MTRVGRKSSQTRSPQLFRCTRCWIDNKAYDVGSDDIDAGGAGRDLSTLCDLALRNIGDAYQRVTSFKYTIYLSAYQAKCERLVEKVLHWPTDTQKPIGAGPGDVGGWPDPLNILRTMTRLLPGVYNLISLRLQ